MSINCPLSSQGSVTVRTNFPSKFPSLGSDLTNTTTTLSSSKPGVVAGCSPAFSHFAVTQSRTLSKVPCLKGVSSPYLASEEGWGAGNRISGTWQICNQPSRIGNRNHPNIPIHPEGVPVILETDAVPRGEAERVQFPFALQTKRYGQTDLQCYNLTRSCAVASGFFDHSTLKYSARSLPYTPTPSQSRMVLGTREPGDLI